LFSKLFAELLEELADSSFSPFRSVSAVEERPLLGVDKTGALA
jgi:hypothetical protein